MSNITATKALLLGAIVAGSAYATPIGTFNVPGTSDPWLAKATIDNVGTPEPADVAPDQSPVLVGTVSPGTTIAWSATGTVGHPGDDSGPDGSWPISRIVGAANGINDLPNTPINALIGVWGLSAGGGIAFLMGSSGSAVVPSGANQLFLGTMDGYGWANNTGSFDVTVSTVPDATGSLPLLAGSFGLLVIASAFRRR